MGEFYEQHRGSLEGYVDAFERQSGHVGAVFVVGMRFDYSS